MSDVIPTLQYSAQLVKAWGKTSLYNGQTLAQAFTFKGLPLWEIFAPELAVWLIPRALSREGRRVSFWQNSRPFLVWIKHAMQAFAARFIVRCSSIQQPTNKPVCIFLGFSPYMYRDVLEPVVSILETEGVRTLSLYDQQSLKTTRKLFTRSIWQHVNQQVSNEIFTSRREFKTWLKSSGIVKDFANSVSLHNLELWQQNKDLFRSFLLIRLPELVAQSVIARNILKLYCPAIIVSSDVSDPRVRMYELIGRSLGIPSIEVQFGFAGVNGVEWQFFTADKLAVRSNKWYEALLEHGIQSDKMVITGSPIYDDYMSDGSYSIEQIHERYNIPRNHKIAVFASVWAHTSDEEWATCGKMKSAKRTVFEAASRVNNLTLIVKPHPCENVIETKQLARGFNNILFVEAQDNIDYLAKACDVFIAFGSITIQLALIARKPVIYPFFPDLLWWSEADDIYLQNNAVIKVSSIDEFVSRLREVVDGSVMQTLDKLEPFRKQFLEDWLYKIDGHASTRIANLAMQMVNSPIERT